MQCPFSVLVSGSIVFWRHQTWACGSAVVHLQCCWPETASVPSCHAARCKEQYAIVQTTGMKTGNSKVAVAELASLLSCRICRSTADYIHIVCCAQVCGSDAAGSAGATEIGARGGAVHAGRHASIQVSVLCKAS